MSKLRVAFLSTATFAGIFGLSLVWGQAEFRPVQEHAQLKGDPDADQGVDFSQAPVNLKHPDVESVDGRIVAKRPGNWLKVSHNPQAALDAKTLVLHKRLASIIDGWDEIPEARVHYFSGVGNIPSGTVNGWQGTIIHVEPSDGGYLVTMRIMPSIISELGACTIPLGCNYLEQFLVTKANTFEFVASLDPDGSAGEPKPVIGL